MAAPELEQAVARAVPVRRHRPRQAQPHQTGSWSARHGPQAKRFWDHHAFNCYQPDATKPAGLLAIPFSDWSSLLPRRGDRVRERRAGVLRGPASSPAPIAPLGSLGMNTSISSRERRLDLVVSPLGASQRHVHRPGRNHLRLAVSDAGIRARSAAAPRRSLATGAVSERALRRDRNSRDLGTQNPAADLPREPARGTPGVPGRAGAPSDRRRTRTRCRRSS